MSPEVPGRTGWSHSSASPEIRRASDIKEMADSYVLFLGAEHKNFRDYTQEEAAEVQAICDVFNEWINSLEQDGLELKIVLNDEAEGLSVTARELVNLKIPALKVTGLNPPALGVIGEFVRAQSPLRITDKKTGSLVHRAVHGIAKDDVEIRKILSIVQGHPGGHLKKAIIP